MKRILTLCVVVLVLSIAVSFSYASWDTCKGCHTDSGKPGPSKAAMLKKFKTSEDLVKAAMASTNPMMQSMKNETILKAAAKDMGLKESKATKKDDKKADAKDEKKDLKAADKPKADKKEATPKTEEPKKDGAKKEEPKKKKAIEGC